MHKPQTDAASLFKRGIGSLPARGILLLLLAWPHFLHAQIFPQPIIAAGSLTDNSFTLSFSSATGQVYNVVAKSDFSAASTYWTSLAQIAGDGSVKTFTDTGAAVPSRYYQLVIPGPGSVYSLNIVGFARRVMQPGTNLVANPLSEMNYGLNTILPNCPEGTELFKMNSGGSYDESLFSGGSWDRSDLTLSPGEGAILVNHTSAPFQVAFVGDVPQGTLVNPLPAYWPVLRGSIAPVNALWNFPAQDGDMIQTWDAINQTYVTHEYYDGMWWDTDPAISPGEAFWVYVSQNESWIQQFYGDTGFGAAKPPLIVSQPQSQSVPEGATVQFTALALSSLPITYLWRRDGTNLVNGGRISGANTNTLVISDCQLADAGAYSVVATDAHGSSTSPVTRLTVLQKDSDGDGMPDSWEVANGLNPYDTADAQMDPDGDGMTNLEEYLVGTNPHDASSRFAFSAVTLWSGQLTLQWPIPGAVLQSAGSVESAVWYDVAGALSPITFPISGPQRFYRLAFYKAGMSVYSVNIVGCINLSIPPGSSVIANPLINGDNSVALVMPAPPDGTLVVKQGLENYYFTGFGWDYPDMTLTPGESFEVWNPLSTSFVNTFVGVVPRIPVISIPPRSAIVLPGAQTNLFVVASGSPPLEYQWRFNGTNLPAANASILALENLQLTNSGSYDVVVTNAYGSTTSAVAVVSVGTAPAIDLQPQSQTVPLGTKVSFTVSALGTEPFTYQWFFNQTNLIANATDATLSLPVVYATNAGSYHVLVSNPWGSVSSASAALNVSGPIPCITLSAIPTNHTMAVPLALQVRSCDCVTSNAIPNVAAVVLITTAGTTRTNYVTTDGSGQATVYFQPLAGEVGHYEVSAGLPNQPSPPAQGGFSIVGIGFETNQLSHRLIVGVPVTNSVELRNLTDVPLSGISVSLVDAPADVTFQAFTPDALAGNGTNTLTYVLKATNGGADPVCVLQVTSAEGATNTLPITIEIAPPVPQLVVTPASLNFAMLRGSQSVASFQVANVGGASSGDLEVLLPLGAATNWLGLVSPPVIPSLAPDTQAEVTLSLSPSNTLPLGPYTGSLGLWNSSLGQTYVPFQFNCVSTLKGDLRVTVVDEFTYYAAGAPKVANATVTLLDPYVHTSLTSAVTGADGVALFTNLTEAYYEVQVTASQHGSFGTVVFVAGDQTFNFTAFLARQMVSYRWIVTTQAITDRYIFTLDTRFETEVPAPVIRVEPGALDLCDYPAVTNVVNLTIFNSGLITAKAARLYFGSHPRFSIIPLTGNLGDLPGQSSVVVPVLIRRLGGSSDAPSQIEAYLEYELLIDGSLEYYRVPIYVYDAGLHDCDPGSPGPVPTYPPILWTDTSGGDGDGSGGTGPVIGPPPGSSPHYPVVNPPPVFPPPVAPVIPVQVGVQLSQTAVMTRQAFEASLYITNGCPDNLTALGVVIDIRDGNGQPANDRFGIRPPALVGLNAVDGTGTLPLFSSGSATWTIIPATNAAPTGPTEYTVGGLLSFQENGTLVQIPLFAVPITVFPDARLVVDYFWERVVYSDDPFTTQVEPTVPFGVGLRMKNVGLGNALSVQINGAQPQIVDNASGLLVDFQLIGSQVGAQPVSPTLTVRLGDIDSGSNAVAAWWMTSSLQGQFTNFSATFTHLDDLGKGNLSLVQSISNHPLVHIVRASRPIDDLVPDFLASDGFPANLLPDHLYLSDGSAADVAVVTSGTINGPLSPSNTNILLTASTPPGWVYLRIPDPGPGMAPSYVRRSDGTYLAMDYNVWTTHRIVRPLNGDPPYREDFLHILDYDSTGSYTIGYNVALSIVSQPQSRTNLVGTTATFTVQAAGTAPLGFQWLRSGTNLLGQTDATLTIPNVQVANAGTYSVVVTNVAGAVTSTDATLTVWVPPNISLQPQSRTNVAGTVATFTVHAAGTVPLAYQWLRSGTNLFGQTDATLPIPNVTATDEALYAVVVTNVAGAITSAVATLTVWVPPQITAQPQEQTNRWGTAAMFQVSATGTAPLSYQWSMNGAVLPGATNTSLVIPSVQATNAGKYSVEVTNVAGKVQSREATLYVVVSPGICPVADQFATVGSPLIITNCTADMVEPVTFALDASAPIGASITADGVFSWTPRCEQGGTTNQIRVWAIDSGTPTTTNSMTFNTTVFDCIQTHLGSTIVLAGHTSSVPMQLLSPIALTNVTFSVTYPAERFTNFTMTVNALQVLTQAVSYPQPGVAQVSFTLPAGNALAGPVNLGQIGFTAVPNQSSAFVRLGIGDLISLMLDGGTAANASGQPGRVVVIGPEPLLETWWGTNHRPVLRLYGNPGRGHVLQWKNSLFDSGWQSGPSVSLTNTVQDFDIPSNAPWLFYRAFSQ